MAAIKENLGKIPCPACGDLVAVYRSATSKLSYTCQHADCESTGYANPGTGAAKKWLSLLPKAVASNAPDKPEKPALIPPKAKAGFSMDAL
jgi:predicted RNA-binding Zn-ribbon protein involved in translation (DUF1610 family)